MNIQIKELKYRALKKNVSQEHQVYDLGEQLSDNFTKVTLFVIVI